MVVHFRILDFWQVSVEERDLSLWKLKKMILNFIPFFVSTLYLSSSFNLVAGRDNVLLGFDPVATLLQHCVVDSSIISPNFLEENSVTTIDALLVVNKINGLEPVSRTFTLTGFLQFSWNVPCVERLYKNETNWPMKKVADLNLNPDQFWKPQLMHRSAFEEVYLQNRDDMAIYVSMPSGRFFEYIPGKFTILCSFDFRKFPFDTQSCSMHLYSVFETNIVTFGKPNIKMMPMPIDESIDWELVNYTSTSAVRNELNSDAFLTFTFNRKPCYYIVTLIIPGFALHCLILVSYFLPPETTDRTVYAATVELAFYFFQIEFNRALPQSSTPIYMQVYLIGMLIGCTLITVYSAILCYIANVNSKLATKSVTVNGKQHQLIYVVDFFISLCFFIISISLAFIPLLMCFI